MRELKIFTIGTGNRSMEEFLCLLAAYQIEAIADVRRIPTSRHRHFKQTNLKASLKQNGIAYHHIVELGGYREGGYTRYMKTREFEEGLQYVEQLARSKRVAITCAELLHYKCHRRFTADALTFHGHTVLHIIDEKQTVEHKGKNDKSKSAGVIKTLDEFLNDKNAPPGI